MFDALFRGRRNDRRAREIACIGEYESRAAEVLERNAHDFFRSGAGCEQTMRLNRSCFEKIRIRPRCLARVGNRSLTVNAMGSTFAMPIGIGPVALAKLAHSDGEKALARAARSMGVPFVISALSSVSLEDVAEAVPRSPKWFQLFIFKDREMTENLVRRAERARYRALVVTVDSPVIGLRRVELKNPTNLPSKVTLANFCPPHNNVCSKNLTEYVRNQFDPTVGWDSLRWLLNITDLPVILKGVLTREDALMAADLGVQGIIVSNHGGRQLDCAPATIEVLPEIVEAVGNRLTVMHDGGITQGSDVFKALALGAKLVFVGRAALWGLAVSGQHGVEDVLDLLRLELDSAMAIAGCKTTNHITENRVRYESEYLMPRLRILERLENNFDDEENEVPHVEIHDVKNGEDPQPVDRAVEVLIPTGEDGLAKFPIGHDGVDDCGKTSSPWCKTVNSEAVVEVVRAPPRVTREVRVVPEVVKVINRNIKADIARRDYLKNRYSSRKAASLHNLPSIAKPAEDCRCIM
ncbi:2-Hydroxyacid oxidase 1-like [Armigeres subalbatus]|uniref:2-Hydroxyacid oxidase 1-like n=1 Tax=Armigeres subalbatus TaxID=124917 RepID=UPI002ED4E9D6